MNFLLNEQWLVWGFTASTGKSRRGKCHIALWVLVISAPWFYIMKYSRNYNTWLYVGAERGKPVEQLKRLNIYSYIFQGKKKGSITTMCEVFRREKRGGEKRRAGCSSKPAGERLDYCCKEGVSQHKQPLASWQCLCLFRTPTLFFFLLLVSIQFKRHNYTNQAASISYLCVPYIFSTLPQFDLTAITQCATSALSGTLWAVVKMSSALLTSMRFITWRCKQQRTYYWYSKPP